ncbi:MarR family winged helix-turn-helix transcriptional regulator [Actinoplanes sp. NPDC051513]|uniref:MarR family winged helix-turn-helix transcriptional regulator n=1 Tax=Actinoplanes sp. NPDC051513 TaxID=3363908 RepID=UPI0037A186C8
MTNTTTPPQDDDVPWLADDERGAWMTLISLLMSLPTAIDIQLKRDSGLNFFEYSILSALSRPPGRAVRMNTLALYAGGSASRLSHAVTRLEKQGWVRREVQNSEIRCTEAMITEKGVAALEAAAPGHVREARRLVFDAITPDQVAQLRQICRQVIGATSPELAVALDQAIVEAAQDSAGPGAAALDQALLGRAVETACTAAIDRAEREQAALGRAGPERAAESSCTAAFDGAGLEPAAESPGAGLRG